MSAKPPAQLPVTLNEHALLIVSGMGRERAQAAAQKLAKENVSCLISFGSAGALSPELRPGDLVQPEQVLEAERKHAISCGPVLAAVRERLSRKNITVHTGLLACSEKLVATTEDKHKLCARTGAIAVDMETAGVLDAAAQKGLPAFALRTIIDPAHMELPAAVLRHVDDFGEVNASGLVIDLLRSPGQIPAVLRLSCASRQAGKSMKLVADELLNSPGS